MALYIVESYDWQIVHGGRSSDGVVGQGGSSDKIYLHLLSLSDDEVGALRPRVDEHGNKESDRLALPRNEEWWIAVEGDKVWPKTVRPKLSSRCALDEQGVPHPAPLDEAAITTLRKLGVALP